MFSFLSPYPKKLGKTHSSLNDLHIDELVETILQGKIKLQLLVVRVEENDLVLVVAQML